MVWVYIYWHAWPGKGPRPPSKVQTDKNYKGLELWPGCRQRADLINYSCVTVCLGTTQLSACVSVSVCVCVCACTCSCHSLYHDDFSGHTILRYRSGYISCCLKFWQRTLLW